jgi:hypothetical protein
MMEHPDNPGAMGPSTLIAHLQQSVQAWIDSDRVLPADGSTLLAALEQLQAELAGGDSKERAPGAAAQAGLTAFESQVQALIAAGLLEIDNDPPLTAVQGAGCLAPERPRKR